MQKPNAAEEDWKLLTTFFPARWTVLAEETAALKGLRQDKSPEKYYPMTKCPHCGKIANPLRFLIYTEWSLYRCSACKKKSSFGRGAMMCVAGAGISVGFIAKHYFGLNTRAGLSVYFPTALAVMILVTWLFLRLYPAEEVPNQSTHPSVATSQRG